VGDRVSAHDYYELLGVNRTESLEGIQTAYRRLAKQCHPDLVGSQGKETFQALQEAYEVLSDPGKRKEYDARVDQRRMRSTRRIRPEPLVPSPHPSRFTHPEPLVRPSSPIGDSFGSPSSRCDFCEDVRSGVGFPCPFCHGLGPTDSDITQFIRSCFRAFRIERF
jgi:curved DNA-binding protein CbpA